MRRMEHVDAALRSFLRSANIEKQVERWQVVLAWPRVVGAEIGAHSEALDLHGTVLWVAVPSSSWRQHILYLKPRILAALAREFPRVPVTDVRCTTGRRRTAEPRLRGGKA
jgi:predicted nucleic acid-binding Zn ribbon protein